MSDDVVSFGGKPLTAAEVKIARAAYVAGRRSHGVCPSRFDSTYDRDAAILYPMPMVERPRVVRLNGASYRVFRGQLEHHVDGVGWFQWLRPADVDLLRALLNDPTERVPADE